jgi:small subunit ribosomal protein S7
MALVFGRWSSDGVKFSDLSLARYVILDSRSLPHSFGKQNKKAFARGKMSIVERLINKAMRSGQGKRKLSGKYIRGRGSCGKKLQTMKIVEESFAIVEKKTKQNPLQVLVKALENAAPREDITKIKKGGIAYAVAVDVAPLTRLDEALKNIALAGFVGSFNKKKSAAEALAEELILASQEDQKSLSVKRRDEVERIAKSSR